MLASLLTIGAVAVVIGATVSTTDAPASGAVWAAATVTVPAGDTAPRSPAGHRSHQASRFTENNRPMTSMAPAGTVRVRISSVRAARCRFIPGRASGRGAAPPWRGDRACTRRCPQITHRVEWIRHGVRACMCCWLARDCLARSGFGSVVAESGRVGDVPPPHQPHVSRGAAGCHRWVGTLRRSVAGGCGSEMGVRGSSRVKVVPWSMVLATRSRP